MAFIDDLDDPELLKCSVNGKPGFRLLPKGDDCDEILFESEWALKQWVDKLIGKTKGAEHAQPYEEWLETYQ